MDSTSVPNSLLVVRPTEYSTVFCGDGSGDERQLRLMEANKRTKKGPRFNPAKDGVKKRALRGARKNAN